MRGRPAIIVNAAAASAACSDTPFFDPLPSEPESAVLVPAAPAPLVPVLFGPASRMIWPFTGRDFEEAADPINLVFVGRADPLALRAALVSLDGNRSAFGFPVASPFDCTWTDAIGSMQTAYSEGGGWAGSAVQMDCGGYFPLRFHVRLFAVGDWTLGGAHFEVLIPGTADHEVLSWELAERLVAVDFIRSGLLDPDAPFAATASITPAPTYRTINPLVYNGLPAALTAALGTPPPPVAAPVPIPNDGSATILNLAGAAPVLPVDDQVSFDLLFNQIVPKPFCSSGPQDYIRAYGPVTLGQTVRITAAGEYMASSRISGTLDVTVPGSPDAARTATVDSRSQALISAAGASISDRFQQILRAGDGDSAESSDVTLRLGPGGGDFTNIVHFN